MRFYCDRKGNWTTAERAARQTADENDSHPYFEVNIEPNKTGILDYLNRNSVIDADFFTHSANIDRSSSDPSIVDSGIDIGDDATLPEQIMEMSADQWAPIFGACLERLNELRKDGVDALRDDIEIFRHRGALEQSLGYLVLHNMEGRGE